ncbi:hypothetical protein C3F34_18735 (plasmid) [Acinetobacter sp. ACNIH2]|nr:hypothetical protein C3F34_18735 [Acinetobacter sp. ACNIH2]
MKVPTVEGIHLLYLEINKIFSLSCQPICNSAARNCFSIRNALISTTDLIWIFIDHGSFPHT